MHAAPSAVLGRRIDAATRVARSCTHLGCTVHSAPVMGRLRRGSIGMPKAKKRKVALDDGASESKAEADRRAMPPPPPRSPPGKKAKVAVPPSPGKKSRRKLASYVKNAYRLWRECTTNYANALSDHQLFSSKHDGRMVRLERELRQAKPHKAWRVSDRIDKSVHELKDSYRLVLETELTMQNAEIVWWKAQLGLEAERSAMLRRRLRKRKVLGLRR